MKKRSRLFKINIILAAMVLLSIGLVQVFAAAPEKTKVSTVNWNMQNVINGKRTGANLYWFKFAFLDRSMASGTLEEVCSNDFRDLKSTMDMNGYFYPLYRHNACGKGESIGMGIIFRGWEIGKVQRAFTAQPTVKNNFGTRGMICVKHLYLDKNITSCVTHLTYDTDPRYKIRNNVLGGRQLKEYADNAKSFAYWTGGRKWAGSEVTFLSGDFNQFPDSVARETDGWQDLVKKNTHNALAKGGPTYQLDYIMVSGWIWGRRESSVSCNLGSDHCLTLGSVWI